MRFLVCVFCLLVVASSNAVAQIVVISSTSPSFKPGQIIEGPILIPDNGKVTFVANDGRTSSFQGPYEGGSGIESRQGGEDLVESLSSILSDTSNVSTLAVFRSSNRPDPWLIKTYKTGKYCVKVDTDWVMLRKRPLKKTTLIVEPSGGGAVSVVWPKNESTFVWPEQLGPGSYTLRFDGSPSSTRLTLIAVPIELSTDPHRANWMAQNGCERQAITLLRSLQ